MVLGAPVFRRNMMIRGHKERGLGRLEMCWVGLGSGAFKP